MSHRKPCSVLEGVISGRFKLLLGRFDEAIWTGPQFPNNSKSWRPQEWDVTADCSKGCLYDLEVTVAMHGCSECFHSKEDVKNFT